MGLKGDIRGAIKREKGSLKERCIKRAFMLKSLEKVNQKRVLI